MEKAKSDSRWSKKPVRVTAFILCVVFAVAVIFAGGLLEARPFGVSAIMNDTSADSNGKKYGLQVGRDPGSYAVELDLDHPEQNAGKVLYQKDGARLVVGKVLPVTLSNGTTVYTVQINTVPGYTWNQATLAAFQIETNDNELRRRYEESADVEIEYGGKKYDSKSVGGETDPKNGPITRWRLYDSADTQKADFSQRCHGKVTFRVSNLLIHTWTRNRGIQFFF